MTKPIKIPVNITFILVRVDVLSRSDRDNDGTRRERGRVYVGRKSSATQSSASHAAVQQSKFVLPAKQHDTRDLPVFSKNNTTQHMNFCSTFAVHVYACPVSMDQLSLWIEITEFIY